MKIAKHLKRVLSVAGLVSMSYSCWSIDGEGAPRRDTTAIPWPTYISAVYDLNGHKFGYQFLDADGKAMGSPGGTATPLSSIDFKFLDTSSLSANNPLSIKLNSVVALASGKVDLSNLGVQDFMQIFKSGLKSYDISYGFQQNLLVKKPDKDVKNQLVAAMSTELPADNRFLQLAGSAAFKQDEAGVRTQKVRASLEGRYTMGINSKKQKDDAQKISASLNMLKAAVRAGEASVTTQNVTTNAAASVATEPNTLVSIQAFRILTKTVTDTYPTASKALGDLALNSSGKYKTAKRLLNESYDFSRNLAERLDSLDPRRFRVYLQGYGYVDDRKSPQGFAALAVAYLIGKTPSADESVKVQPGIQLSYVNGQFPDGLKANKSFRLDLIVPVQF